jgi:hypothetical protein
MNSKAVGWHERICPDNRYIPEPEGQFRKQPYASLCRFCPSIFSGRNSKIVRSGVIVTVYHGPHLMHIYAALWEATDFDSFRHVRTRPVVEGAPRHSPPP